MNVNTEVFVVTDGFWRQQGVWGYWHIFFVRQFEMKAFMLSGQYEIVQGHSHE